MPLTPRFVLSQTDDVLTVTIRTPHVRVSASTLEVVIEDDAFHFYSPPYLLRLSNLPGRLVDDAESGREAKAVYDPSRDNGTVTVTICKAPEDVGHWGGLDLVGRLMMTTTPSSPVSASPAADENTTAAASAKNCDDRPAIEVLSSEEAAPNDDGDATDASTTTIAPENATSALLNLTAPRYGFLQLYHSVFTDLAREGLCPEMMELPEPDVTLEGDRRSLRLDVEADKFDPGRYLDDALLGEKNATSDPQYDDADGCGGDMIFDEAVRMEPHWTKSTDCSSVESITNEIESLSIGTAAGPSSSSMQLTEDEMQLLASVPATHMPPVDFSSMNQGQIQSTLLLLLDIMFAYAYDHRTTAGDATVESSWTVAILSPTLSWFDHYNSTDANADGAAHMDTPADVLLWCIRRSLVYPYLRSYNLSALIAGDAIAILRGGRRVVLRCLLHLRKIFENSTGHYLLNKLYVDPLIFWVQSIEESSLSEFAQGYGLDQLGKDMRNNSSKWKDRIGLNLIGIENMLYGVQQGESEGSDESDGSSDSDDDSFVSEDSSSEDESDSDNDDEESVENESPAKVPVSSELLQIEKDIDTEEGLTGEADSEVATRNKPLIQEL